MQPSDHLELAAFACMHGPRLVAHGDPIPAEPLNRYWSASKVRWEHWMRLLKRFGLPQSPGGETRPSQPRWPRVRGIIQEIVLADIPARVWAAVMAAADQQRGVREAEPIARGVLVAQAEARCRALRLLLHTPGVSADDAMRLNRLRRQADRWSDVFVGHLAAQYDVAHFAANPNRAKDFASDFRQRPEWQPGEPAWSLLGRAWRRGLASTTIAGTRLNDGGEDVAAAMLECFEPLDLLTAGLTRSLWLMRFQASACHAHELLEQLCHREFVSVS